MSSKDAIRSSTLSTPIPLDMIEAWLRGEYLISQNESSGYELLGYSLMLRGLYVYTVTFDKHWPSASKSEEFPDNFTKNIAAWGICKIDLRDGDILFHGIRLGLNANKYCDDEKDDKTNSDTDALERIQHIAWYSIFSKLTRVPGSPDPDMYFGYVLVPLNKEKESVPPEYFRWYCLMGENRKANKTNTGWQGFELPITQDKNVLTFTDQYSADFRAALCEYLETIEGDLDRPQLENKDTVSAIGHIALENWKDKMRWGRLQSTSVTARKEPDQQALFSEGLCAQIPAPLSGPGILHLFPLMHDNPGAIRSGGE